MKRYRLVAIVLLAFLAGCHLVSHLATWTLQVTGTIEDEKQEDEREPENDGHGP
jgi:hypothetical protein